MLNNISQKLTSLWLARQSLAGNNIKLSFPFFHFGMKINLVLGYPQGNAILFRLVVFFLTIPIYTKNFISKNYIMINFIFKICIPSMFRLQRSAKFFCDFFYLVLSNLNRKQSPFFQPRSLMLNCNFFNFSFYNLNLFKNVFILKAFLNNYAKKNYFP